MGGIFDKLQGHLGSDEEDHGISPLDLADMEPGSRRLMRFMLREVEVSYDDLRAEADALELTLEELDEALLQLTREQWLIQYGEEHIIYEANLRHKAGSTLAKSLWGKLDARIQESRTLRQSQEMD